VKPFIKFDLYDYGLRWYHPDQGRFINRDPIGEQGGLNLYAFVGNDPVNLFDFLGLDMMWQDLSRTTGFRIPLIDDEEDPIWLDPFRVVAKDCAADEVAINGRCVSFGGGPGMVYWPPQPGVEGGAELPANPGQNEESDQSRALSDCLNAAHQARSAEYGKLGNILNNRFAAALGAMDGAITTAQMDTAIAATELMRDLAYTYGLASVFQHQASLAFAGRVGHAASRLNNAIASRNLTAVAHAGVALGNAVRFQRNGIAAVSAGVATYSILGAEDVMTAGVRFGDSIRGGGPSLEFSFKLSGEVNDMISDMGISERQASDLFDNYISPSIGHSMWRIQERNNDAVDACYEKYQ